MPIDKSLPAGLNVLRQTFPFLLLLAFGLFMLGYFLFPDYSNHYRFFARFVFLLGIFAVGSGLRDARHHPVFLAVLVYMFYLLLTGLWSDPIDWYRLGQKLTIAIYLLVFILINVYLVNWNRDLYERILQVCVLIAAAAALANMLVFYSDHAFPKTRMHGFGSLTNINEFSNIYGVFALLAMAFALRPENWLRRLVFLAAVGVFVSFAWFGQSRMAFVALVFALLVLVVLKSKQVRWLYAVGLVVLVGIFFISFPELLELAFTRGEGARPTIWVGMWPEIRSAFIAGNGLTALPIVVVDKVEMTTAHNAFLQVLWQGGVIGLALFVYLLATALRHAWRWGQESGEFVIFCMLLFAICAMMTGVDTLIERPRDQWMLFWVPVALLIACQGAASSPVLQARNA